ncbi:MAG: phage holin family protein [Aquabacterium sp.]|nr:phage holin family protein [Aquabacterium sp.]
MHASPASAGIRGMNDDARHQAWARSLQDLLAMLPGLVSDRLELLALELQRASRSLVQILTLVLVVAVLGSTAWLALCGAAGLALVVLGLAWPLALLAVVLVNLLLAWAAMAQVRRLLARLGLPATRRHLAFGAGVGGVQFTAQTGAHQHP